MPDVIFHEHLWTPDFDVWAFDVDDTLQISGGPVTLAMLTKLRDEGHIVGYCGNWAIPMNILRWREVGCFAGPMATDKPTQLRQIAGYVKARYYTLVGNDPSVFGKSNDIGAAKAAGWHFVREDVFAKSHA